MSDIKKTTKNTKIYRRKPEEAFEAMQFTDEPGNVNAILTWMHRCGWHAFYEAPRTQTILSNPDGTTKVSRESVAAIGFRNPDDPYNRTVFWIEKGEWIRYVKGENDEYNFYTLGPAHFDDRYEEI